MDYQHKIIVSNRSFYKEFELPVDLSKAKLGTTSACEFRLNSELFFYDIELELEKVEERWILSCSDMVYISKKDSRKLLSVDIDHGDVMSICYADTNGEAFEIRFLIDFEVRIPDYSWKINLSNGNTLVIGDSVSANIVLNSFFAANTEVRIERVGSSFWLKEIKSRYGVNLNGYKLEKNHELKNYDFFSIADYSFFYKNGELYLDIKNLSVNNIQIFAINTQTSSLEYPHFNRNTRVKLKVSDAPIEILDPPEEPQKPKENILMSLIPSIIMLAMTVVIRGFMSQSSGSFVIFSVVSMGMGIITSVITFFNGKKIYKQECDERIGKYKSYIERKEKEIEEARQEELAVLNRTYFDLHKDFDLVEKFSSELFDRAPDDEDFLQVYLGKGKVISKQQVDYKMQEKMEQKDELSELPYMTAQKYRYLYHAPIVMDVKMSNAIGIIGNSADTYEMFKNIVLDICIRHYYGDVKLFTLIQDDKIKYDWLRLLPHLNNEYGIRNIVCDNESRNTIFENLFKELSTRKETKKNGEYYVILVMEEHGIKNHPLSKFIPCASELNCTFIFFENKKEEIPLCCNQIVELTNVNSGKIYESSDGNRQQEFEYNFVTNADAERIVRKIAPIYCEEISLESSLRKNISLFELLKIYSVKDIDLEKRWQSSEIYKSMAAPLGINAKNEVICLDLHEKAHGPHGLVAGTTGSGKSEILQSYVLSAATLFHPYEIGFVIIDFKGGGMVNQFKNLPHLIGAITNIDGREIDRSLKSIKAELLKRQSLFAEANVNHIDKYIKLFKEHKVSVPLPHLVIIVDEFAELKAEQPEFMKELISAARIGRSLGIHLILATQKPAGQVNEQIWSNSKFKLCLKVQNQEDSKEVLKSPLAAEIREPGRAYLQVGNNEIFELFQSAYSGGPSVADSDGNQKKFKIYMNDFAGRKSIIFEKKIKKSSSGKETELEAIVSYIDEYCKSSGIQRLPGICLPALEDVIYYKKPNKWEEKMSTVIDVGLYDDPDNQQQSSYYLNISEGNTVIVGSAQMGKTSFLQTVLRNIGSNYSPDEVAVYILDFASKALKVFEGLNHVGGVVTASEDERLKHFIKMMRQEVTKRKDKFSQLGITSFHSYKEAGYFDLSHIVIIVDNFPALRELYAEYEDDLLYLCREGITVGITFVVTSIQSGSLGYRYLSNFGNRIAMYCNDSGEYSTLFDRCRMEPKYVPGRSLIVLNKTIYECQTYLAFHGEREIERVQSIKAFIDEVNSCYPMMYAKKIPAVPARLDVQYLKENCAEQKQYHIPMGMDYNSVDYLIVNLARIGMINIAGREGSGKTNIIRYILNYLQSRLFAEPSKVYVFDDYEQRLSFANNMGIVELYSTDIDDIEVTLENINAEVELRRTLLKSQGADALNNMPLILCIIKNESFYETSTNKQTVDLVRNIIKNGKNVKVCFICANIDNMAVSFTSSEMMKYIKETKNLLFMDDYANLKILDVNAVIARQQKKPIELGDAFWITEKDIQRVKTVLDRSE